MGIPTSTARANMPLIRILILALIFLVAYRLIKRVIGPGKSEPSRPVEYEDMVTCTYCKVHLPRNNAITRQGKTYCSQEHAQAGDS